MALVFAFQLLSTLVLGPPAASRSCQYHHHHHKRYTSTRSRHGKSPTNSPLKTPNPFRQPLHPPPYFKHVLLQDYIDRPEPGRPHRQRRGHQDVRPAWLAGGHQSDGGAHVQCGKSLGEKGKEMMGGGSEKYPRRNSRTLPASPHLFILSWHTRLIPSVPSLFLLH